VLPEHLQEDIVNRLEDAVDIARAKCVCKSLRDVADHVQSLRIICKEEYHASVRNEIPTIVIPRVDGKSKASTSKAVIGGTATGRDHQAATPRSRATQPHEADHQVDSNRGSFPNSQSSKKHKFEGEFHPVIEEHQPQIAAAAAGGETTAITSSGASSNNNKVEPIFFRHLVPEILRKTKCIVRLWIEIDPKLQSKKVADGERVFTDHWLTDPLKVNKWIPSVQATLQDLCIVDYGQQAISRPSSLLAILSQTCKSVLFRHSCTLGSLVVHNQLQRVMESHPVLSFLIKILQKDIAKLVEFILGKKIPQFPQFLCQKKKHWPHPVCHVEFAKYGSVFHVGYQ
jgi:hypothetical protein